LVGARNNLNDLQRRQAPFTSNPVKSTRNTTPATVARDTGVTNEVRSKKSRRGQPHLMPRP
jgi:hypothetical protein